MTFTPVPLNTGHDLSYFSCGEPSLDEWLSRRAFPNQIAEASKTYVIVENKFVVGYYCLAAGSVSPASVTGRIRRNMPDPLPAIIIGRLAVSLSHQGRGLGATLLNNALERSLQAAEILGCRAILVSAINKTAAAFYDKAGFIPSPVNPLLYMMLTSDARATLDNL